MIAGQGNHTSAAHPAVCVVCSCVCVCVTERDAQREGDLKDSMTAENEVTPVLLYLSLSLSPSFSPSPSLSPSFSSCVSLRFLTEIGFISKQLSGRVLHCYFTCRNRRCRLTSVPRHAAPRAGANQSHARGGGAAWSQPTKRHPEER